MPKKAKMKDIMSKHIANALNAAFMQGRSAQRLEDAQTEFQYDSAMAQQAIGQLMELVNTPDKKDMN